MLMNDGRMVKDVSWWVSMVDVWRRKVQVEVRVEVCVEVEVIFASAPDTHTLNSKNYSLLAALAHHLGALGIVVASLVDKTTNGRVLVEAAEPLLG